MFKVKAHEARSVGWWYSQKDEIDFDPPYQRGGNLWSIIYKANLIDSLMNEYDIPKIYLADFTIFNSPLNLKKKSYSIIDGRQRFEAIFGFREDVFPLNEDFIFYSDPSLKLGGLTYTDLIKQYPKVADRFREFNLHVMSVITDDEAKINDLFVRLNTSKPLTGAEIRNAMAGKVPIIIRDLANHRFFTEMIKFSKKRSQDKNAAAKLLLLEFRGKFVDTKKVHLDRFVEEGEKTQSTDLKSTAGRVSKVLDEMCKVFVPKDNLLSSQGPVPLYYWLVRTNGAQNDMREFLVKFEKERRRNRTIAREKPIEANQELLSYDILNRSVDDQASNSKRLEILLKYYEFLEI